MKKEPKEYILVDGKLQESTNENVNSENSQVVENTNSEITENKTITDNYNELKKEVIAKQMVPVIKIKDFNLHYNLTKNPFLHKNSDHDEISSIEEYYILKGKKYYNFGCLLRTKLLASWTTKHLIKKAFKNWRSEADNELSELVLVGDAQDSNEIVNEKEKKVNFFLKFLPFISLIILIILMASNLSFFNKPEGIMLTLSYVSLLLTIIMLGLNNLFNKSISKYNIFVKKGKNEYKNLKEEFISECNKKFDNTEKYYCKKINRKFDKKVLSIDDVSIDEGALIRLQEAITKNSKVIVDKEKIRKRNTFKRRCLNVFNVITLLLPLIIFIYSIIMHFIKK